MEDSLYFAHLSNREGGGGGGGKNWSVEQEKAGRQENELCALEKRFVVVFFVCVWFGGYLERSSGIYVVKQRSQPQFSSVQFENNVLY